MTQQLLLIGIFLGLLAALPWALRRLKDRISDGALPGNGQSRFISAVAVGPSQRVVTVEVGPEDERVWLTVGVTAQSVTCLHTAPAPSPAQRT